MELSRDGKTLTTTTTTSIFDANGTLLATRCTRGSGSHQVRVETALGGLAPLPRGG